MKRRQRKSASEWAAVVGQWQASGLTAEEFGQRNDINGKVLSWWKWHLGRGAKAGNAGQGAVSRVQRLVPVRVVVRSNESPQCGASRQIEVVVRGGRALRLSVNNHSELLGLIRLLEDSVPC